MIITDKVRFALGIFDITAGLVLVVVCIILGRSNDNLLSNEGNMSAAIGYNGTEDADETDIHKYKEYARRNNSMIFLCRDCMRDFLMSLQIDVFGQ